METTVFLVMNIIGLISFAAAGTIKALENKLDLFGIFVLGITNALGGGIIRDTIIDKIPFALTSYLDMSIAVLTILVTIVIFKIRPFKISSKFVSLFPDAVGLAAFATTGALIATEANLTFFGVLILSATTAIGGGVSGDLLIGKIPNILKDDYLYASCAILGASSFFLVFQFTESNFYAAITSIIVTLSLRLIAIVFNLKLPRIN